MAVNGIKWVYLAATALAACATTLNPKRGGISLAISLFFLLFVALPAAVQHTSNTFPYNSSYTDVQLLSGYAVFASSQLAMVVGQWLSGRKDDATTSRRRPLNVARIRTAQSSLAVASILILSYLGLGVVTLTRGERGTTLQAAGGFSQQLLFVGRSLSLVAVLLALASSGNPSTGWRHRRLLNITTISVALLLNFPTSLSRFQLIGSMLCVFALLANMFSTRVKVTLLAAAPIFLLTVFPQIKSLGVDGTVDLTESASRNPSDYLLRVDFDAFKQVVDTGIYLDTNDFLYGKNFGGVALFWIPRSIWEGKPESSGSLVSAELGFAYTNVSSPLQAESLLTGGVVALTVVFVLLGYGVGRLEQEVLADSSRSFTSPTLILYSLSCGFSVIVLRGSLNGVAPMFATAFAVYWLMARYICSGESAPAASPYEAPGLHRLTKYAPPRAIGDGESTASMSCPGSDLAASRLTLVGKAAVKQSAEGSLS